MLNVLQKKLKDSEQSKLKVERMYKDLEVELKVLQEEKDRLKINVRDLTEYIEKKENNQRSKGNESRKEEKNKVCLFLWKEKRKSCNKTNVIEEQMYTCDKCDFQSTKSTALSKHMNIKHRTNKEQANDVVWCTECDMQFSQK